MNQPRIVKKNGDMQMAPYEPADATALQAMWNGTADSDQQRRALTWILECACAIHEISFRPGGEEGRRATDFAEGRRFVGKQIAEMLRTNVTAMLAGLRRG